MMTRNNIKLLYFGVLAGILGLLSKLIYRPLVYRYSIDDFGISDRLPNLFAVVSLCLILAFMLKKRQISAMIAVCLGIIAYEIDQLWSSMIFDYYDIIASLIGLIISIIIYKSLSVSHFQKENKA